MLRSTAPTTTPCARAPVVSSSRTYKPERTCSSTIATPKTARNTPLPCWSNRSQPNPPMPSTTANISASLPPLFPLRLVNTGHHPLHHGVAVLADIVSQVTRTNKHTGWLATPRRTPTAARGYWRSNRQWTRRLTHSNHEGSHRPTAAPGRRCAPGWRSTATCRRRRHWAGLGTRSPTMTPAADLAAHTRQRPATG
jgi:hypothetical protein